MDNEIVALSAIYGDQFQQLSDRLISVSVECRYGPLLLIVSFPVTYPAESPTFSLSAEWPVQDAGPGVFYDIPSEFEEKVMETFKKILRETSGEPCVFDCVEFLRQEVEYLDLSIQKNQSQPQLSSENQTSQNPSEASLSRETEGDESISFPGLVTCNEAIIDRKSVFVAHYAPVKSLEDVKSAMAAILSNKKVARATHNISAYRIVDKGTVKSDCDDDGETAAGARLLHLLHVSQAENCLVVVSRWFGGIHLGPARFKHINNAARKILEQQGVI